MARNTDDARDAKVSDAFDRYYASTSSPSEATGQLHEDLTGTGIEPAKDKD